MPLSGQDTENSTHTLYQFKIIAQNEVNISDSTTINAIAMCTNIRDYVKANENIKSAIISNQWISAATTLSSQQCLWILI